MQVGKKYLWQYQEILIIPVDGQCLCINFSIHRLLHFKRISFEINLASMGQLDHGLISLSRPSNRTPYWRTIEQSSLSKRRLHHFLKNDKAYLDHVSLHVNYCLWNCLRWRKLHPRRSFIPRPQNGWWLCLSWKKIHIWRGPSLGNLWAWMGNFLTFHYYFRCFCLHASLQHDLCKKDQWWEKHICWILVKLYVCFNLVHHCYCAVYTYLVFCWRL